MTSPPSNLPETAEAALAQARQLFAARRTAEAATFVQAALDAFPTSAALWNVEGALLRQQGRPADALAALDKALHLDPALANARVNRGLVRQGLGDLDGAIADLGEAVRLSPKLSGAWLNLADAVGRRDGPAASEAVLDQALAADPDAVALLHGKAILLRSERPPRRAEAFLRQVEARFPDLPWVQFFLGDLEAEHDPDAGEARLRRALALDPADAVIRLALIQQLSRRTGGDEGRRLDEADGLARALIDAPDLKPAETKVLREIFAQVCDFDALARLGGFAELGRGWAAAGLHTALLKQLPRVETDADRRELLAQHRLAGEQLSQHARRSPIRRPAPRPAGRPIRLGLLSSDLRRHPVGYFVEPLFEHLEPGRFELFAYGFDTRPPDDLQDAFAARATAFRRLADRTSREAAQVIADDDLDVLVELGGTTAGNRLDVMAWRPAPWQLSWLGYPHSAGLEAIDGLVCDRFNRPLDDGLLAERPVVMPRSWIALGPATYRDDRHAIAPGLPQDRAGALTFGTANNTYKYTPRALQTWAQITAAVPGARFMFIRPEGASARFRGHVLPIFQAAGVPAERVIFRATRGGHLDAYNEVDVSLDTFPLTGGTTTVDALWMGVPVVSLVGPAFYERLSWSILNNVGAADLAAEDLAGYARIAIELAADRPRRAELRTGLRRALQQGPLGDTQGFARDFYDLMERVARGEA